LNFEKGSVFKPRQSGNPPLPVQHFCCFSASAPFEEWQQVHKNFLALLFFYAGERNLTFLCSN
jgi:hypothetical protein